MCHVQYGPPCSIVVGHVQLCMVSVFLCFGRQVQKLYFCCRLLEACALS